MRAALILAAVALLPATAHAATRADVANEARAIIAQTEQCDHPTVSVELAYVQVRRGVSIVQMTTALPYTPYPTEQDIAAMASRVLPAPRTTNGRLLADGFGWLERGHDTLAAAGVCE